MARPSIVLVLIFATFSNAQQPVENDTRLKACQYLIRVQRSDGSWGSTNYGILKSGQAYTPFVLYALLKSGDAVPDEVTNKALSFMRSQIRQGVIGQSDPLVLEYPVYSTAYALMCFKIAGSDDDQDLIKAMERFLIRQQFDEEEGFDETHPAYGGWGFGGRHPPGNTGHMDLAHVRRVLEALTMKPRNDDVLVPVKRKAQLFLKLVQKHVDEVSRQPVLNEFSLRPLPSMPFDGGFYFSPVVWRANKGRMKVVGESYYFNSYATTTCDGLLALVAAGVASGDKRVLAAKKWLNEHVNLKYSEGIPEFYEGENWREAVTYYHWSVRNEVAKLMGDEKATKQKIEAELAPLQKHNGSFVNEKSSLMKEDDPIMATALAVIALQ